jgi:hypothetical protein
MCCTVHLMVAVLALSAVYFGTALCPVQLCDTQLAAAAAAQHLLEASVAKCAPQEVPPSPRLRCHAVCTGWR